MSAMEFQAAYAKLMRCSVDVHAGREFDWNAGRKEAGGACVGCDGCDARLGQLGLADDGVSLSMSAGALNLVWKCPGCGCEVSEETTALGSLKQVAEVRSDGLCYRCRRRAGVL